MAIATDVKTLESRMFVAVNTADNNNKFWKYERLSAPVTETNNKGKAETGDTRITWGRVGAAHPDQQLIMWDVKTISSKIADKTDTNSKEVYSRIAAGQGLEGLSRKGKRDDFYTEVKTIGNSTTTLLNPRPSEAGFTLIELLIVLAILAIVAVLGIAAVLAVLHFGFHKF